VPPLAERKRRVAAAAARGGAARGGAARARRGRIGEVISETTEQMLRWLREGRIAGLTRGKIARLRRPCVTAPAARPDRAALVGIYGRRRVGKTQLVRVHLAPLAALAAVYFEPSVSTRRPRRSSSPTFGNRSSRLAFTTGFQRLGAGARRSHCWSLRGRARACQSTTKRAAPQGTATYRPMKTSQAFSKLAMGPTARVPGPVSKSRLAVRPELRNWPACCHSERP
jgi:hypothetical protein